MRSRLVPLYLFLALPTLACGGSGASGPGAPAASSGVSERCREELALTTPGECQAVEGLLLPERLPPARGNAVGDSLAAAQLGFQAFFDPRFSTVTDMSCATCHQPERSFGDSLQVSVGKDGKPLRRNSPSILTVAWMPSEFFWDGRADTLWAQPLFALENESEMASTRLALSHSLFGRPMYLTLYENAFGPMPDLSDATRFPPAGKPGDAAFDNMAEDDKGTINRIAANFGKALEAYMRKVATGRSPLDAYLLGDDAALGSGARRGLSIFVKAGCADCHEGPALSDGLYHDVDVPNLPGSEPDPGRAAGIPVAASNPFNAQGPYYDRMGTEPPPPMAPPTPADEAAFRTPSLRDVGRTAPYMHNGAYATLDEVLAEHGGTTPLDAKERASILAFLLSLSGKYPERPWSNWPTN